jgi:hypothetical protein
MNMKITVFLDVTPYTLVYYEDGGNKYQTIWHHIPAACKLYHHYSSFGMETQKA